MYICHPSSLARIFIAEYVLLEYIAVTREPLPVDTLIWTSRCVSVSDKKA